MKIIYIECDAEEMRANRTILDAVSDTLSSFTRAIAGVDVNPSQVAEAMASMSDSEEEEYETD